ncbi:dihydropteroate synthase [candidate division KSB1 bacterium]|nr:dihydropteroate synthase [candidate division KSB1 bacterium]
MILIGERINAGFKDIKAAIENKDGDVIKEWARKQTDKKATYLDVNLGTASNKPEDLCWMIEMVQEEVDTPISIDNNRPAMLKEAIPVCKKPPLVNSTLAIDEKMDELLPLVAEAGASIIGLVMDETGSPKNSDKRIENAGKIFAKIAEYEMSPEQLFLDPIVMPLKFMQEQAQEILKAAGQFGLFSDPPCHIVCGLSNISNGTTQKSLINRTFCTMMIANGLDAVILDVMDDELVNAILTAELIMNKSIYADSYIEAFRR